MAFLIAICTAVLGTASGAQPAPSHEYLCVSLPSVALGPRETIYGFAVDVRGGAIFQVSAPFQWNLGLDNSTGSRSVLKARTVVGNSALDEIDVSGYFRNFIEVGNLHEPGVPFRITIKLTIIDNKSGHERQLVLGTGQLKLQACSTPSGAPRL